MLINPASFSNVHCIPFHCSLSIQFRWSTLVKLEQNDTWSLLNSPVSLEVRGWLEGESCCPLHMLCTSLGSTWLAAQFRCAGFFNRPCTAIGCTLQVLVSNPSWVFQHLSHGKRTAWLSAIIKNTVIPSTEWFCLSEKKVSPRKKVTTHFLMESCSSSVPWQFFCFFFSFAYFICINICVAVALLHMFVRFTEKVNSTGILRDIENFS